MTTVWLLFLKSMTWILTAPTSPHMPGKAPATPRVTELTAALAEATGATFGDVEFVALNAVFGHGGGDSRSIGGWCVAEDDGPRMRSPALLRSRSSSRPILM